MNKLLDWWENRKILWIAKWHRREAEGIAAARWAHRAPIVWEELSKQVETHRTMAEHLFARVNKPKGGLD